MHLLLYVYLFPGDGGHNYYKGLTEEQAKEADLHAQLLASLVLNNPANDTDLKKITEAAQMIDLYCMKPAYEDAVGIDYRSPYGVFVTKNYSCAEKQEHWAVCWILWDTPGYMHTKMKMFISGVLSIWMDR